MATQGLTRYRFKKFWNTQYRWLDYKQESFNDEVTLARWQQMGFTPPFTGEMCDMRSAQPSWNTQFIEIYQARGWKDIGTSYYCMRPGTVLPVHRDTYSKYIELFALQEKKHTIRRAVVFLEDWHSGHYFEGGGEVVTGWKAGDVVEWEFDLDHIAANLGTTPRYTLQITGHV
jgi:hypothetical protein